MIKRFNINSYSPLCYEQSKKGKYMFYADYRELEKAVQDLLFDVKSRYPEQDLYCPFMKKLDELVNK